MAKRRTSQLQRRPRATEQAMNRRASAGGRLDWRLAAVGGVVLVVLVVVVVALLFGSGTTAYAGTIQKDDGRTHIADGTNGGPYDSVPATSGPHWQDPANWGIYTRSAPLAESQSIHNLEHGGIIVWYQPDKLSASDISALEAYVTQKVASSQFKFILSPWTGKDFGHPIAVTAWRWLLYLDSANTDAIGQFASAHYNKAPEPLGGPPQPGS